MIYKSYKAPSYKDAVLQAKMDFGNDVYIIGRKEVREGGFMGMFTKTYTEITVARNEDDCKAPKSGPKTGTAAAPLIPAVAAHSKPLPAARGDGGSESERGSGQPEKAKAIADAAILKELLDIKKSLKEMSGPGPRSPHLAKLLAALRENDFSEEYIDRVGSRLEQELTLKEATDRKRLEEKLKEYILESIETSGPIKAGKGKPTVVVLVGPTGVGKTTTIAKLAATYGILQKHRVEIFTIDSYRIAAIEQLGKYAELMQLPFTVINSREEFKNAVQNSKAELVFVDTAGRSPKNSLGLAELRDILDGVRSNIEIHLVVSATTKYRDAMDIFTRFNQLLYSKVIITKLDEANTIGPLVSVLSKERRLSYLANGQSVPDDIELAEKEKLLNMLIIDEFDAG
jgi:flagellar biosynthesis protein FlhF